MFQTARFGSISAAIPVRLHSYLASFLPRGEAIYESGHEHITYMNTADAVFDREILGFWIETVFSDINGLEDEMYNRSTVTKNRPSPFQGRIW